MNIESIAIDRSDVQKLLGSASGDCCLLYIYLRSGNSLPGAAADLGLTEARLSCAMGTLRQLGLWADAPRQPFQPGERPQYTEQDVLLTIQTDNAFRSLYGEIQRRLGRVLSTEELKILLGFVRYLGLPEDVICVLVSYCIDRNRQKGNLRNPALRTIEKEAYNWAEQGIDTLEAAAAFIHSQNVYRSRLASLLRILQIRNRSLTPAEEKYARQWLDMGMEDDAIAMAYERTCMNTGNLNWAYMHKILTRWQEAGLKKAEDIRQKDRKPSTTELSDSDMQAAIARMMQEG